MVWATLFWTLNSTKVETFKPSPSLSSPTEVEACTGEFLDLNFALGLES